MFSLLPSTHAVQIPSVLTVLHPLTFHCTPPQKPAPPPPPPLHLRRSPATSSTLSSVLRSLPVLMGNASAKEGPNSNGPPSVPSLDPMASSPPETAGRFRPPVLFSSQVPAAPLHSAADVSPVHGQFGTMDARGPSDAPTEKGIPTLITWMYGGNDVAVQGSWDNWTSRKALQRTGKDHSIILVLSSGVYHYKFIVDGEWRYIPDLPCVTDGTGQTSNILDVNDYVPENLDGISEFDCPPSPESTYSQSFPADEDFAKEPPVVPSQLHVTVLGSPDTDEAPKKPQHAVLNHLFIEKGWASESLVALGLTHRYQSKYVTVVLYKPLRR